MHSVLVRANQVIGTVNLILEAVDPDVFAGWADVCTGRSMPECSEPVLSPSSEMHSKTKNKHQMHHLAKSDVD